jgi:hypothetical protein
MQGWPSILSGSIVMRSCTCALTGDHPNICASVPSVAMSTVGRSLSVRMPCAQPHRAVGLAGSSGSANASDALVAAAEGIPHHTGARQRRPSIKRR